jgi:hypothetical protein
MRILSGILLALVATLAQADRFDELHRAGLKAYARQDYPRLEELMRAAEPLHPAHPRTRYNLAAALALQGRTDESLAELATLAELGLGYRPAQDADFSRLRQDAEFRRLSAALERNRQELDTLTPALQHRQVLAAYFKGDYPRLQRELLRMEQLRPREPRSLYNYAAALVLLDSGQQALPLLAHLADAGYAYNVERDPDFASLRQDPEFQRLAARFLANYQRGERKSAYAYLWDGFNHFAGGFLEAALTGGF